MSPHPRARPDPAVALLDLYDQALPHVYGYLLARVGDPPLAEDLTAETFLAAVAAARRDNAAVSTPWLIGVARHKLADHWRRATRDRHRAEELAATADPPVEDPWEVCLDAMLARDTLARLGPHHRAALTLRYLDGLPVPEVAAHLGRTTHATEALLVRARAAFRRHHPDTRTEGGQP